MRSSHQFFLLLIWCTCVTVIQRTETFLFRRKAFHQLMNDPYQVKPNTITSQNLFKWMNLKSHIRFKLWTRKNPKWAQEIKIDDLESLHTSNYDSRRLTKVLIHGWAHSANEIYIEDWIFSMRDAYLRLADLNILIIDYSVFALPFMYWTTAPDLAGQQLSELIKFLVRNGAEFNHFHMLGYSWGAHVAGIAGHKLNGQVSRITGMDPANPTFRMAENAHRLDKSDALYVDIIHTGGGPFLEGHLGLNDDLAHADFYPNGGRTQPGCGTDWGMLYESIECDHGRSVWYFVESINSPYAFFSCKCDNWSSYMRGACDCPSENSTHMGEFSSHSSRGRYYLFTRGSSPFGFGPHLNLTLQSLDGNDPDLFKFDHMNFNFTSSSARRYLSRVVQKSLSHLPVVKTSPHTTFRSSLLSSIKEDSSRFKNAVMKPLSQTLQIRTQLK